MGQVARERDKHGWYRDGSRLIAQKLDVEEDLVKGAVWGLLTKGFLLADRDFERRIIGIRLTEVANSHRIAMYNAMFPDIKALTIQNAIANKTAKSV